MYLGSAITVADATKVRVYMKNFGEFYLDQVEHAGAILLSRTQKISQEKITIAVDLLRKQNTAAAIVTTPWDMLTGETLRSAIEQNSLKDTLIKEMAHPHDCGCGHDHGELAHDCGCGHDHGELAHDCGCGHDHGELAHDCGCGHNHGELALDCGCGHDHGHHHAEDVFTSWGIETPKQFTKAGIEFALNALDSGDFGMVLRAKGIVPTADGWLQFDYVPQEASIRAGSPDYTGRLCVIGANLNEASLTTLFGL